ncbi:hypothetical protein OGAPHI_006755 [Ogataea philodendri]|uniref:Uncharacterized protein n=2 Tax=Saccharomycotina TaxID=147537 RepID=A0A9P8NWU9_9ASCO|nr:uncharacterized protein OGAPHI_006755 [Ogataea philodendri]KAH3661348.1 hypothetical protein OGAPHI_006755 [Ogataea philodendri]
MNETNPTMLTTYVNTRPVDERVVTFVHVVNQMSIRVQESGFGIVCLDGVHSGKRLVEMRVNKGSLQCFQSFDFSRTCKIKVGDQIEQCIDNWNSDGKPRKIDDTENQSTHDGGQWLEELSELILNLIIHGICVFCESVQNSSHWGRVQERHWSMQQSFESQDVESSGSHIAEVHQKQELNDQEDQTQESKHDIDSFVKTAWLVEFSTFPERQPVIHKQQTERGNTERQNNNNGIESSVFVIVCTEVVVLFLFWFILVLVIVVDVMAELHQSDKLWISALHFIQSTVVNGTITVQKHDLISRVDQRQLMCSQHPGLVFQSVIPRSPTSVLSAAENCSKSPVKEQTLTIVSYFSWSYSSPKTMFSLMVAFCTQGYPQSIRLPFLATDPDVFGINPEKAFKSEDFPDPIEPCCWNHQELRGKFLEKRQGREDVSNSSVGVDLVQNQKGDHRRNDWKPNGNGNKHIPGNLHSQHCCHLLLTNIHEFLEVRVFPTIHLDHLEVLQQFLHQVDSFVGEHIGDHSESEQLSNDKSRQENRHDKNTNTGERRDTNVDQQHHNDHNQRNRESQQEGEESQSQIDSGQIGTHDGIDFSNREFMFSTGIERETLLK